MSGYGNHDEEGEFADALVDRRTSTRSTGRRAGASEDGLAETAGSGAGGGATRAGSVLLTVAVLAGVIACALVGVLWHKQNKMENALTNDVAPVLEYVFNVTQSGDYASQTFCTNSFRHVATGTDPSGTVSLDKREVMVREQYEVKRAAAKEKFDRRDVPMFEYPELRAARGFPSSNTELPGTEGTVSILRVGSSVRIKFAATGLPSNLSVPVPYWEDPDVAFFLGSYIPYECIPPVAAWPDCNTTIFGVVECTDVVTGAPEHPVFFAPEQEAIASAYHTHLVNGYGWFDGSPLVHAASSLANGYYNETTYVVGTQSQIFPVFNEFFNDLLFAEIRGEAFYKTDAPIDWTVPEGCISTCI